MLDNEGVTYNRPKRPTIPVNSRQSERALITVDRSQKLDLLIHLLTNLQQSLVICGPEGIGKSTLLKTLESSQQDIWPILILTGSSALSFESVANQLSRFLNLSNNSVTFDLSSLRAFCAKQTVVLAIDNSGELMPGLIGELMDFADSLPGLRFIFALSNDNLAAKSASDTAIDACHFIELPPLNQRQCLEFLQNLSAQPEATLPYSAITDELVEDLYRRTQGVPGKLLAELPHFKNYQSKQHWKLALWTGVAATFVVTAFAAKYWLPSDIFAPPLTAKTDLAETNVQFPHPEVSAPDITPVVVDKDLVPAGELIPDNVIAESLSSAETNLPKSEPAPEPEAPLAEPTPAETDPISDTPPKLAAENMIVPEPSPEVDKSNTSSPSEADTTKSEVAPEVSKTTLADPVKEKAVEKPVQTAVPIVREKPKSTDVEQEQKTETTNPDIDWIMAQPADHYTVQVMVLSSQASVTRLKRKYAQYSDALKAYSVGRTGQQKYVILYGSFPTAIEALNTKSEMPSEFTSGLVKRFNQVQRQTRRK